MERMIGSPLDVEPKLDGHVETLVKHAEMAGELYAPGFVDGAEHALVGPRQSGKTFHAMRWLLEASSTDEPLPRRVLVVASVDLADELRRSHGMKRTDERIISWRQLLRRGAEKDVEYGFDDAGEILANTFGLRTSPRLLTVTVGV